MLTEKELSRYDRQIIIPGFGMDGQEKLKRTKVFLAGCGGLGSAAALYLAVAGIGNIKLIDNDTVELSNLNRQVLHWNKNIGQSKVSSFNEKLTQLNPDINIESMNQFINESNVAELISDCDVIVDALDNMHTRYLINGAAVHAGKPIFHGAVYGMEGRAMTVIPGQTPCLACLYHAEPAKEKFPILGAVAGVIACIQVTEVVKYLTGIGTLIVNRMLVYDGLDMKFLDFSVQKNPECECCQQIS